ncbi:hypothetical protein UlMin_008550 [Ulmus minor]
MTSIVHDIAEGMFYFPIHSNTCNLIYCVTFTMRPNGSSTIPVLSGESFSTELAYEIMSIQVRLTVEVPSAVCDDCYSRVPGFRPGKNVPESILVNYVGKKNVQKATVESILERTLPRATSAALRDSIRIVTKFSDIKQTYTSLHSLRFIRFTYLKFMSLTYSFSYVVIVDVALEVKWTPENGYENLKIVFEIDSDIDAQKSQGSLRIVTNKGLQIGDVVVLNISATTIDQDESNVQKIPSAESKGFHFDTEDGNNVLPSFLDSIVGINASETKSFPLVFPKSWRHEHLRGVHAQFTVECKELFYRDLPELNDSFVDKLFLGCTTLEQVITPQLYFNKLSRNQQRCLEVEQAAKEQATDNAIFDQLCKFLILFMVEVDIPRSLFEEQGRQLYGAKILQIHPTDKQLASLSSPKSVNEYREHQRENITMLIKHNLAVGDIFKHENLEGIRELESEWLSQSGF